MEEGAHVVNEKDSREEERVGIKIKVEISWDITIKAENQRGIEIKKESLTIIINKEGKVEDIKTSIICEVVKIKDQIAFIKKIALS